MRNSYLKRVVKDRSQRESLSAGLIRVVVEAVVERESLAGEAMDLLHRVSPVQKVLVVPLFSRNRQPGRHRIHTPERVQAVQRKVLVSLTTSETGAVEPAASPQCLCDYHYSVLVWVLGERILQWLASCSRSRVYIAYGVLVIWEWSLLLEIDLLRIDEVTTTEF